MKPILAELCKTVQPCLSAKYLIKSSNNLHVKNGVGDDLGVKRDLVGTLGEAEDDGVGGPKATSGQDCISTMSRQAEHVQKGHASEQEVESSSLAASVLSS